MPVMGCRSKMKATQQLKHLQIEAWERQHGKKVHQYFTQEFDVKQPKTAAQLEALIDEYCSVMGAECTKITTAGRNLMTKTKASNVLGHQRNIVDSVYIPGTTRKGTSDLIIGKQGRVLYVEVKLKDRQSPDQKAFQKRVESFGNTYVIVRSLDEFGVEFEKFFKQ